MKRFIDTITRTRNGRIYIFHFQFIFNHEMHDSLNERRVDTCHKFHFMKVGLVQRHFSESVSKTGGLLSDEAFASSLGELRFAYLD